MKQSCLKDLLSQKLLIEEIVAKLCQRTLELHNLTNVTSARRQSSFYFQSKIFLILQKDVSTVGRS